LHTFYANFSAGKLFVGKKTPLQEANEKHNESQKAKNISL